MTPRRTLMLARRREVLSGVVLVTGALLLLVLPVTVVLDPPRLGARTGGAVVSRAPAPGRGGRYHLPHLAPNRDQLDAALSSAATSHAESPPGHPQRVAQHTKCGGMDWLGVRPTAAACAALVRSQPASAGCSNTHFMWVDDGDGNCKCTPSTAACDGRDAVSGAVASLFITGRETAESTTTATDIRAVLVAITPPHHLESSPALPDGLASPLQLTELQLNGYRPPRFRSDAFNALALPCAQGMPAWPHICTPQYRDENGRAMEVLRTLAPLCRGNATAGELLDTLQRLAVRRAAKRSGNSSSGGLPLVLAGTDLPHGIGNQFTILSQAAVEARVLDAGCLMAFGGYASHAYPFGSVVAFPCIAVRHEQLTELRILLASASSAAARDLIVHDTLTSSNPVYHSIEDGRVAFYGDSASNRQDPKTAPSAVHLRRTADMASATRLAMYEGPDTCDRRCPPGMPVPLFWLYLRAAYTEALTRSLLPRLPPNKAAIQMVMAPKGVLCGHMRMTQMEKATSAGPVACSLCDGVLKGMAAMFSVGGEGEIFSHYFYAAPQSCDHCIADAAPRLMARAQHIRNSEEEWEPSSGRVTMFETERYKKFLHVKAPATGEWSDHTNVDGALLDMHALGHCTAIVVDDAPQSAHNVGTFSFSVAAAFGFTTCESPLPGLHGLVVLCKARLLTEPAAQCGR